MTLSSSQDTLVLTAKHHGLRRRSRELNWPLLIGSIALLVTLIPSVYVWHRYQLNRVSGALLERATELEQSGDDKQAVHYLYRSLQLTTKQPEVQRDLLVRIARCYDRSSELSADKATVIQWYYRAVGASPDDLDLQLRLAELFLETQQFVLAEEQSDSLIQTDSSHAGPRRIRALARYGQMRRGRPVLAQQVRKDLQEVQRRHPSDVQVCEALAYIYRNATPSNDGFDPIARADAVMDTLVRSAPQDYRAYLARHKYRVTYHQSSDARDVRRAIQLAPEEPDVIYAAAENARRTGDFENSVELFRKLVVLAPKAFRGHLGLGEALYRNGQLADALAAWQAGLSEANVGRLPLRVRLIEGLIEDEQLDVAKAQLRQLDTAIRYLTTNGGEEQRDWIVASRDLLRAKLHMAGGEYRKAVVLLQRVATTAKADRSQTPEAGSAYQAWLMMGQSLLQLQQWEDAATSFQRALQIVPRSMTARLWAARAWSAVGRDDQALVLCEQAVVRPNAPDNVWLMLAQLHLRTQMRLSPEQRDWQRLEQILQRASAALPDSWEIPLVRANLLMLRDADTGVGQAMQIVLAEENAHPVSVPMWSNLVFLYERMGLASEADRSLRHLKELQTNSAQTSAWEVALLAARGDFKAAQSVLDQFPTDLSDKDQEWADRSKLLLAYQEGDLTKIRDVLIKIHAKRPQRTQILAQLADLALTQGNWVESDRWISRLQSAEGADGVWWRFFKARRLLASDGASTARATGQVTRLYDEIRRLRPWWPGVAMLRGLLAESQGVPSEAADAYATAIQSGFQQPHVYERLIRVLYQQGRFNEANQWLNQLQQNAPLDGRVLDLAWSSAIRRDQTELAVRLARQNFERHSDEPSAQIWLAQMLAMSGEHEEAESLIDSARQLNPRDLASRMGFLAYALRTGNKDDARKQLDALREHSDLPPTKYHALAAHTYQQLGDREAAEQQYREAIRLSPDDTDLRVRFATYLQPFDPAAAEIELRTALSRTPDHAVARRTLATWLHGRNDSAAHREANELLQNGETTWQQQASDRRLEAVLLMRRGRPSDLQSALILLEDLVNDSRQETPEDRLLLGRLYERTGNVTASDEQLRRLADSQPGMARHVAVYIDFLLRRKQLDEAQLYLEKLERLAPISLTAVSLRSRILLAKGQVDRIDAYVESFAKKQLAALHDSQQRRQFMLQVANLFSAVNRQEGAERWYRQLVAEFPDQRGALAEFWLRQNKIPQSLEFVMNEAQQEASPATVALLARVLVRGDVDDAQRERAESLFADVLQQHPEDASFLFSLASLRLKQARVPEAEQLLRRLTDLHPEHVTAWNNLAAILADDPARLPEALTCIDRAIAAAGRPIANLLDTKAVILLQENRNDEALELLRQVLSLADNGDSRFHFHYAVAQQRLGGAEQAKQAWARAKALGLFKSYLTDYEKHLADFLASTFGDSAAGS